MLEIIAILVTISNCQVQSITLTTDEPHNLYINNQINNDFVIKTSTYDCSAFLYAYSLNQEQFLENTPSQLQLNNVVGDVQVAISSFYNYLQPQVNQSACSSSSCTVEVRYYCSQILTLYNYFDIIQLDVQNVGRFAWYIKCNQNYNPLYFQWGQFLITIISTIVIILGTVFARLDAFQGSGVQFTLTWVIILALTILAMGQLIIFAPQVAGPILDVLTWILGTISVGLVILQSFYRFIRHSFLNKSCKVGPVPIRGMDVLCLFLGAGVVSIWWFTSKNWIISDVITICMAISAIKVFKITSLKIAILVILLSLSLFVAGAVEALLVKHKNFFILFQFSANSPFQFQMATISPTYAVNCAWISITSIALPGLLVAYLHRFDKSRATNIYLISSIIAYFLGSLIWNIISAFSREPVPFDAVSSPFVLLTLTFMAFNRKELRTIWDGTFYDQEFINKADIEQLEKRLSIQMPQVDLIRKSIPRQVYLQTKDLDFLKEAGEKPLGQELLGNDKL